MKVKSKSEVAQSCPTPSNPVDWWHVIYIKGFPSVSAVRNLPAKAKMQIRSLGWEDPLVKAMTPTPVFLPGKSHGQWSLVGYCPWGHKESDTNEWREDQIRLPVDCSAEKKKKYRKKWHDIFKKLKGKNLTTTKWLYLARLSLRIERQDKEFHRKAKAKWVYHH